VDQREGAGDGRVRLLPILLHQLVPYQVTERLGAVGIAALRNQRIELLKQILVNSDADTSQRTHARKSTTRCALFLVRAACSEPGARNGGSARMPSHALRPSPHDRP